MLYMFFFIHESKITIKDEEESLETSDKLSNLLF
jgi:hypothetical protein